MAGNPEKSASCQRGQLSTPADQGGLATVTAQATEGRDIRASGARTRMLRSTIDTVLQPGPGRKQSREEWMIESTSTGQASCLTYSKECRAPENLRQASKQRSQRQEQVPLAGSTGLFRALHLAPNEAIQTIRRQVETNLDRSLRGARACTMKNRMLTTKGWYRSSAVAAKYSNHLS